MRKKYLKAVAFTCAFSSLFFVAPAMGQKWNDITENNDSVEIYIEPFQEKENIVTEDVDKSTSDEQILILSEYYPEEIFEEDIAEEKIKEAQEKIFSLDHSNKMEWFKQYKQIQKDYSEWLDPDETIYDVFSQRELELLFRIVETEVRGDERFESKVNVANVIFNRMEHDKFPETITDVLTARAQFSSYSSGAYKRVKVTETTKLACEYAFQFEDTTNGSLWFDSTNGHSWADRNRILVFTDAVGHSFYK